METIVVSLRSNSRAFDLQDAMVQRLKRDYPAHSIIPIEQSSEWRSALPEATIVITWHFGEESYALAPKLKTVMTPAAGHDWVKADPAGRVKIVHGAFHGPMMAESLLGLMLFFNRRFDRMLEFQRQRRWNRDEQASLTRLCNQTVLLIGYGRIGKHCARLIRALGARVIGLQRKFKDGVDELGTEFITREKLDEALAQADHVALILPGEPDTTGFLNREHLARMKKTAFLYNIGRGNTVSEADLVYALENKHIAGAGLDVFEQEPLPPDSKLWGFKNVFITPHSSCAFMEYGEEFYKEVKDFLNSMM